jgi:hypothetical protein
MLDLPRYLLGVAEILLLAGFAGLGAHSLRARLLPGWSGPPGWLADGVVALALLIWSAEVLGSFGLFEAGAYLVCIAVIGAGTWALSRGSCRRGGAPSLPYALLRAKGHRAGRDEALPSAAFGRRRAPHPDTTRGRSVGDAEISTAMWAVAAGLLIAAGATVHFAAGVKLRLSTGMTGFDSTWYHGPFAAGFFQSGNTWELHFIAPQFLAWFYPANAELFHGVGMLAFGRDLLSPLLNFGWFLGCLLALWCIGRPYRVAPWSLALGAIALSLPVLSDQAGEARNDIVGIFFLLAAVAIALNGTAGFGSDGGPSCGNPSRGRPFDRIAGKKSTAVGALAISGLAAGLAAGTKLNFLLPAAVLVLGLAVIAPAGLRWRALWISGLGAVAGGGYWYLRNLIHTGNPLPWFDHLGPISLPAPEQALGGREGHNVLGYLGDRGVWSDWFLPGLHHGLSVFWPLLGALVIAGLVLALAAGLRNSGRLATEPAADGAEAAGSSGDRSVGTDRALAVAALTGLAAALAWSIAPTSASGPDGMPRGFESGLRYLAPALILGLALLPVGLKLPPIVLPSWLRKAGTGHPPNGRILKSPASLGRRLSGRGVPRAGLLVTLALLVAIALGYPIQRHYLEDRYATPTFAAPGLNAAFKWANSISGARIATTGTRQYPLYGRDLSNHVQYIGIHTPHGGFIAPSTCRQWRRLLDEGHYDYVVATRDRPEPGKPPYPASARWTAGPWADPVLSTPPTKVYKLTAPPDPSACP